MWKQSDPTRRRWLQVAGAATAGFALRADDKPVLTPLFDGRTLDGWMQIDRSGEIVAGWEVKDGAMSSTGAGRGVIYTARDFSRFRLMFTMRHVSGNPDHQACVLIFCRRPQAGEKPLDALGGIQFQVPNGGHWDYRPGMNNAGGAEFTKVTQTHFDPHE
ncbi:MAG TPA: DUF1080 domain-containing protein, partial [Verrucomicrobiae bacterium]|nr:DUF1080 domain-containing protein [Verrucomicrobiae bacterium]